MAQLGASPPRRATLELEILSNSQTHPRRLGDTPRPRLNDMKRNGMTSKTRYEENATCGWREIDVYLR